MWASHLRSCLLSHHVRPAEPFPSFLTVCSDHSLSFRCSSVPFFNPVSRTLPPIAACYCTKHSLISPPAFSPSLSLLATWGNDSITYDPIHLLMMFGHSKAYLRPIKSAFHSLCSSLSVSTPQANQQGLPAWDRLDMHMCVCLILPCGFSPCSLSSETLTSFGFVYEVRVGRVGMRRAVCQEKHMALLGWGHLLLDQWECFQNH